MIALQFFAEWAFRSSILILSGALLLQVLRVKDPSIRLGAWTALLCGSMAIPFFAAVLPRVPLVLMRASERTDPAPALHSVSPPEPQPGSLRSAVPSGHTATPFKGFDWTRAALGTYILGAFALLFRLCLGLAMSMRLLRNSRPTGQSTDGIGIRESDQVAAPVALGIARPVIVLPRDWPQWDSAKLQSVLMHEQSHISRCDPAVQFLSAIHRAVLWHSPMSWFLHKRIVRAAEDASDDAAIAASGDRTFYAQVLLDFLRRGVKGPDGLGVSMARYGRPDERIQRILDGTTLSRGITKRAVIAMLAMTSPLAYVVAAASIQSASRQTPENAATKIAVANTGKDPGLTPPARSSMTPQLLAQAGGHSLLPEAPKVSPMYLPGLGTVVPFYTVRVKPRIDGQLTAVTFKEGDLVQAGQVLASIDPRPLQLRLVEAEGQLAQDQGQPAINLIEGRIKADQAVVDEARLQLSYAQVTAPITGNAGLRLVDPGNFVRSTDASGIVVITQVQPIAVLFTIPEDELPAIRALLRKGMDVPVEAWNRDNTAKLATGLLTAVDNQIDEETGTAKLKAVFDNRDESLYPSQFVNTRMRIR
jgi:multidrug efflux pump subunit AcrA (membrane-fusion protein)